MISSKQIPLGGGWHRMGMVGWKLLLYATSWLSMATAFVCCAVAIAKYGFKRVVVKVAIGSWMTASAAYYVFYVAWPTPEMLVTGASENDFARVQFCLGHDVDINSIAPVLHHKAASRRTALTAAVRQNYVSMVDFLLERGADPNQRDGNRYSPFDSTKSWELGDRLLSAGTDINARNSNRHSPLEQLTHWPDGAACPDFLGNKTRVVALFSRGAEITELARLTAMNRTDLRMAMLLETLRREHALSDSNPYLAFLSALLLAEDDVAVRFLEEHPELANYQLRSRSAKAHQPGSVKTFRIALRFGRVRPLREWLLAAQESGIDVKAEYLRSSNVHIAATHGHVELLELLKEFGADLSSPKKPHSTPLACAARYNHLAAADWLIGQGVEIDACEHPGLGNTALATAIVHGHLEMVELLVNHGASISAKYYGRQTLFDLAVDRGHPQIAAFLLSQGAKPTDRFYRESWARKLLKEAGFTIRR